MTVAAFPGDLDVIDRPLVPPDFVLVGMKYMPLMGDRLFSSASWVHAGYEGRCAMLALWWHAFANESPPGSLPANDEQLAEYAGYGQVPGQSVKAWLKVKAQALQKWQFCLADGRLYHHVVADLVLTAGGIQPAEIQGEASAPVRPMTGPAARQRRHKQRIKEVAEQLELLHIAAPKGSSLRVMETMLIEARRSPAAHGASEGEGGVGVTRDDGGNASSDGVGDGPRNAGGDALSVTGNGQVTHKEKENREQVTLDSKIASAQRTVGDGEGGVTLAGDDGSGNAAVPRCAEAEIDDLTRSLLTAARMDRDPSAADRVVVAGWLAEWGWASDSIRDAVNARVAAATAGGNWKPPTSLKYFDKPIAAYVKRGKDGPPNGGNGRDQPIAAIDPAARAEYWRRALREWNVAGRDPYLWHPHNGRPPPERGYQVPDAVLGEPEFRGWFPTLFPDVKPIALPGTLAVPSASAPGAAA